MQKDQHDDEDQDEGLEEGLVDFVDRFVDEDRRVVDDLVLDAFGKRGFRLSFFISARMASAVVRALEPGNWKTAKVTDGWPSR